jgi:hypothetical protein
MDLVYGAETPRTIYTESKTLLRLIGWVALLRPPTITTRSGYTLTSRWSHRLSGRCRRSTYGGCCQDAGPHPLRHSAKKERIINEHDYSVRNSIYRTGRIASRLRLDRARLTAVVWSD